MAEVPREEELARHSGEAPKQHGFSTYRNQRALLSGIGLARIARELAQLSWIRTAMQSPLGKIPLVADARTQALASGGGR